MTDSAATLVAIVLGLGIFLVIVAVGWRSVQNRRILRGESATGQETIIVAGEDDEITNVTTTSETTQPAATSGPPSAS
jgi:cytoskeletal protein RodZ